MTTWRHKKRGTNYVIVSDDAAIQCSTAPEVEERFKDTRFVIYQDVITLKMYVRPYDEFHDGRFEELTGIRQ